MLNFQEINLNKHNNNNNNNKNVKEVLNIEKLLLNQLPMYLINQQDLILQIIIKINHLSNSHNVLSPSNKHYLIFYHNIKELQIIVVVKELIQIQTQV